MVSASITALTRLLHEFRAQLKEETITDLVQTMDLFLTSNNREIVGSVLGFVKECIISLPTELLMPRLQSLIPNLITWSHEHKAHFKVKVKHIFERMIRRVGVEVVERYTPEEDRKLITNIRKTKERNKKKRSAAEAGAEGGQPDRRGRFESEYDEAVYGSGSEDESESDISDEEVLGRAAAKGQKAKQGSRQYIVEDEDEPLDLLDRRALAHVSSTKPSRARAAPETAQKKAKVDIDGKLVFNEESDDDFMNFNDQGLTNGREPGDGTLEGGINAYVNAIKGKDAPQEGQRGKLKFKNKGTSGGDDEMEIDEGDIVAAKKKLSAGARGGRGGKQKPMRRGLGAEKMHGPANGVRDGGVRKGRGRGGVGFKHGLQNRRGRR
jgi:ribosomal RNA-processing protein 12